MKKFISACAALILLLCFDTQGVYAAEPGFDCNEASNRVERLICQSDALARQDLKLAGLYENVMAKLPDREKKRVKKEQLAWLKHRNDDCDFSRQKAEKCLLELYGERNAALAALVAFDSADRPGDEELKLLRITPKGDDVPAGQQVVFQFDRPVVPVGRMERDPKDIPIEISPRLNCEWRWLNTSALACQLREEHKMKQATRYSVKVSPGISTESGAGMKTEHLHEFTTARPKVTYTRFVNWLSPGTPLLQVTFNQPVTKSSLERSMLMIEGGERVEVVAFPDDMPRTVPFWMQLTDEAEQPKVNDMKREVGGEEARKVWVIEPVRELPLDQTVSFDIQPGLISSEGPETGIESRTVVKFDTYPEFEFIGLRCTFKGDSSSSVIPFDKLKDLEEDQLFLKRCSPLNSVSLVFSAPVLNSAVKDHVTFEPRLDGGRDDYDPWENTYDWTSLSSPHMSGRDYQVWLPELLRAYRKYSVEIDRDKFTDEFGRKLKDDIAFDFFTSHREPDLTLNHYNAVLEKAVDTDVPLYVTNLDEISISYQKIGDQTSERGIRETLNVAKAEDIAYAMPMGVRDLIGDDTGALYGSLHPDPEPPNWYHDPEIFAQVTPYQVHGKFGHFSSLVWVTGFNDGEPVDGAKVTLYKGSYQNLVEIAEQSYSAQTDKSGLAQIPGIVQLDPELKVIKNWYNRKDPRYFVKVEKDGDIALIPIDDNFIVHASGAYAYLRRQGGHDHAWGTTAQGVYKLGDTVEYKIYVRDQSNRRWVSPAKEGYSLTVQDPQQKVVHEVKDITLNKFGAFDGSFKVPEQGAVGWYVFNLSPAVKPGKKDPDVTWQPMSVLISDFTPAPFKVKTELNGEVFSPSDQVQVSALATMHAGGPFTDAEIRLTARLSLKNFITDNPITRDFIFGASNGKYLNSEQTNLLDIRGKVDDAGQYEDQFLLPEADIYYGDILVESAVKDDRGKFVAATARADYAGRDRYVGLRNTSWIYKKGEPARLETVVVDRDGKLIRGMDVEIAIFHREYKASRVKGPGNAYLTKNIMEWVQETSCKVKSSVQAVVCEFKPENPGYYQFTATIKDTKNREHKTSINGWVTGPGVVVWDQTDDATLQIVPEQTDYKIGETARYLIKNPFPGAKALVTVERYGILDSWIEVLKTSTPIIEVPVKPDYLPGFYLSVVAISPRVDKPIDKENVDLGKPSYRMGYVEANVSDPYKQITIGVETDRDVYKPREKVTATIQVGAGKKDRDKPYELAVAVVDESVLALNRGGRRYYDPYAGFNRLDPLDVNNYSLISRLVGRQRFEKKGANPGGGGGINGQAQLRNLFKFVSYWNPSITPDADGSAVIEFEVPDNLTGWRILAFAVDPDDRMGLGDGNFKVNRPTELRPVMPNQVVEGDEFKAGFSLMNRTAKDRRMAVEVSVDGPLAETSQRKFTFDLAVPAYKRESIWLPLETKGDGELLFIAKGGDKSDADAVQHKVVVNKRRSLETAATYGTTTSDEVSESIQVPDGIYTDVGEVGVVLSPSVIGNIDGAFNYVKDYPYWCWEQRLTKAVVASSYIELQEYLKGDVEWPTPEQDVKSALENAANFQAPNGGMVYWVPSNRHVSPYLSAYTAIAFNWLRRDGYEIPAKVEERLHQYLLNLLRKDEYPSFFSKGMASSVRAVALAALSERGVIGAGDITRYQRHVAEMDLFGKAHYLQAAVKTAGVSESLVNDVIDTILGHASQSGGKFQFNEEWDDSYSYILATPLRSNCTILSALLSAQVEAGAGESVRDIPFKLVRSITQSRGNRDHWENTQENVFCLNAIIDYSNIYEAKDPAMKVSVKFDGDKLGKTAFNKKSDPGVKLARPLNEKDPGKKAQLVINRKGEGRLYYSARLAYDLKEDNASRINAGIEIRREYSVERDGEFVILTSPMDIRRGEIVKVDLFVSVPTARHFVVVDDPVPGGLEPVNTDLATNSIIDAQKGSYKAAEGSWWYEFSNWTYYGRYFWSFYHKELRHDSARFYADYLPAGNYHLSYTAQAIAEGRFSVMPVHGEEMYDPDVYGKGLPATLRVGQ